MELPRIQWRHQAVSMIMFVLLISFTIPISPTSSNEVEKDQLMVPQEPHASVKCGECPCVNPCGQLPPPPPPPSPPPPPKNKYCSPLQPLALAPPPPRFVFVTGGVPGEVYQTTDNDWEFYSRGERNVAKKLLILAGCVLGFLTIW